MVQTYGYFCMLVSLPIEVDEWKKHQTHTSKKKKKKVYANVSQICSPFTALFCLFIPSFSFLILTNNSSLTPRVRTRHSHFYRRGFFPRVKNAFSLTKHSFSLWQALFTFFFFFFFGLILLEKLSWFIATCPLFWVVTHYCDFVTVHAPQQSHRTKI